MGKISHKIDLQKKLKFSGKNKKLSHLYKKKSEKLFLKGTQLRKYKERQRQNFMKN